MNRTKEKIIDLDGKEKRKLDLSSVDATVFLVLLTAAIALMDFYSHPNHGMADLERRKILTDMFGPIINHIGNFGFSAALATSAVFAKHIFQKISSSEIAQKIVKHGFLAAVAFIFTLNALIEIVPRNNELLGDLSMGILGATMAVFSTELAIKRLRDRRISG